MLDVMNLTKSFGAFKALDDLSMHIPEGTVYGLVGPNGAGKSTLIRCLTGVYRPDKGTVLMEGQRIYENPGIKSRIGYIPDDIFYFPSATMEDMRAYYRSTYPKFDNALFERLFEAFQLPRKSPIRRFSKGMQKQAAFHLAICTRPDVLVLDEPVDGLDPVMRRQVLSLILSDVAERGVSVLVSSYNLRELEDICDHVGILDHGKILLERSLADMQGNTVKLQMVGTVPGSLPVLHTSASGRLSSGNMEGSRRASMDFPAPGEPMSRMLWPPAAATSSARFTFSCPITSRKSGNSRSSGSGVQTGAGERGCSPRRWAVRDAASVTPYTVSPPARVASAAFSAGTNSCRMPASFAARAMGSTPLTPRSAPVRDSSPRKAASAGRDLISPAAASRPTKMGRS